MIQVQALCPSSILAILHDQQMKYNNLTEQEIKELNEQLEKLLKDDTAEFERRFKPQTFKAPMEE